MASRNTIAPGATQTLRDQRTVSMASSGSAVKARQLVSLISPPPKTPAFPEVFTVWRKLYYIMWTRAGLGERVVGQTEDRESRMCIADAPDLPLYRRNSTHN